MATAVKKTLTRPTAQAAQKTTFQPRVQAGKTTRTITIKLVIGHAKGSRKPAIAPELLAEEIAFSLRQLRERFLHLSPDELRWEFPFWAKSLNS